MANINYFILLVLMVLLSDCKKEKERLYCGVKDPITEFNWLVEKIESVKANEWTAEIYHCTFNNEQEGFYVDECMNCCQPGGVYYDCEGNIICGYFGFIGFTCPDSFEVITSELIWEYSPEPEP